MYEIKMNEKSLYTLYQDGKEIAFFFDGVLDSKSAADLENRLNNEPELREALRGIVKIIDNVPSY